MESGWERASDHVALTLADINRLILRSGLVASSSNLIEEGKANTNYRLSLVDGSSVLLRLHTREPASAGLEAALSEHLAGRLPVPRVVARGAAVPTAWIPTATDSHEKKHPWPDFTGVTPVPRWSLFEWLPGTTMERLLETGRQKEVLSAAEDLGRALAVISSMRFDQAGFLDSALNVSGPWPSVIEGFLGYLDICITSGNVDPEVTGRVQKAIISNRGRLDAATAAPCLSHADYKASNLLIHEGRLSGVLDWEFAHSGTWLLDAGQLFRHREHLPAGFREGFERGFGELPEDWFELAQTIDLINLVGFLSRPNAGPNLRQGARRIIERNLQAL